MQFKAPLIKAIFRTRLNRFLGEVEINGGISRCFIPNPGRMKELLKPRAEVYLLEKITKRRKTNFDLLLVEHKRTLVSIDSRVPNKVMLESIDNGLVPEFKGLKISRREPKFGNSRLDFLLEGKGGFLFLEVKSCTLVKDGTAFFPDAPTIRGSRHIRTLMHLLSDGRAAIFFLVQRDDAFSLRPNEKTDPVFAQVLRKAADAGVEIYAYNCKINVKSISIFKGVIVEI